VGAKTLEDKNQIIQAAVFASGNGSNAENIIRFAQQHPERLNIAVVVCDQPDAGIIDRAHKLGVPCMVVPLYLDGYATRREARADQEIKILKILETYNIQWLFLAGFMQIVGESILDKFFDKDLGVSRIVNIHPSLLPEFPGKDSYRRAYDAGVETAGVTLHFVDDGIDTGRIIRQKKFARIEGEEFADFQARGLALEYQAYTEFLEKLINGQITKESIDGNGG
jgi:phosphoribosylglycinamide formyltransferase-1